MAGPVTWAGLALACWSSLVEPRRLVLSRHRVETAGLAADRGHLSIAVLSDLHVSWPHVTLERLAKIVSQTLELEPDLVLLPGDFAVTGTLMQKGATPEQSARVLAPLAERARCFAVLGNHDHDYGGARITRALEGVGIDVLDNDSRLFEIGGGPLQIVGIDCLRSKRADLVKALERVRHDVPTILLSHIPDIITDVPAWVTITIAGHTHGGQIRLPFVGAVLALTKLPRHTVMGLSEVDGRKLFVSAGIGTTGLPVRFGVPPEIALIELIGAGSATTSPPSVADREPSMALDSGS